MDIYTAMYSLFFLVDDKLLMTKQGSNYDVDIDIKARDSATQENLKGLLDPLLGPLHDVLDKVEALLDGLGLRRRHHHDHHDYNHDVSEGTIYNYGPSDNHIHERSFYADAIPGTAALVVRVVGALSLKTVLIESRAMMIR